jgi:hypothetical protein
MQEKTLERKIRGRFDASLAGQPSDNFLVSLLRQGWCLMYGHDQHFRPPRGRETASSLSRQSHHAYHPRIIRGRVVHALEEHPWRLDTLLVFPADRADT